MIKKQKCTVCGHRFTLRKENTYQVAKAAFMMVLATILDAVDCPMCGCQVVLSERLEKVVTNDDNKVN